MTAKTYRVKGIDLHIDGEHIPEGSEIELTAEPGRKLRRWLEPLEALEPLNPVEPVKPVKEPKSKAPAKDDKQADGNKDGQDEDKQPAENAEETKA